MLPYLFNGIEVDMLSLGDADSLLVSRWASGSAERVLIDGGGGTSVSVVRQFLRSVGVSHLDHVVVTHPHADHADGVIELLRDRSLGIGRLWFHIPYLHLDILAVKEALKQTADLQYSSQIAGCLQRVWRLQQAAGERGIPHSEPFTGASVGFLWVCGPALDHYRQTIAGWEDPTWIRKVSSAGTSEDWADALLDLANTNADSDSLASVPHTAPENDLSIILWTRHGEQTFLFTGDTGAQGLLRAAASYKLDRCHWMQVPHHGSRRNITEPLIAHFSPRFAYVSAEGGRKHPRRAVVNAFKRGGSAVYSTHYPQPAHLRSTAGVVPARPGYGLAVPLWESAQ